MTPETRLTAIDALGEWHDALLVEARDHFPSEFKDVYPRERRHTAQQLLRIRRAMRELRNIPINLGAIDCE